MPTSIGATQGTGISQPEPSKDGMTVSNGSDKNGLTEEEVAMTAAKTNAMNGEKQNNNIDDKKSAAVDSKELSDVKIKKEKKPAFEDDDPFAALDWKDGIATLPGKY